MAGLHDVFTMGAHKARDAHNARLAPLEGGLPDMGGGGNAATASPDHSNAPDISIAPNSSPLSAAMQGANQAGLSNMAGRGLGLSPNGLFSGNVSQEGALSTAGHLGLNVFGGAIPGFGISNAISKGMGALSGIAALFGLPGQQTDGHLSGPITEGFVAQVARNQSPFNNPLNVPTPHFRGQDPDPDPTVDDPTPTVDEDGNPAVSDPDGGGSSAGAAGSASGPGGSAGAPSGGGDSGNPGDFHKGGTVRAKKAGGDVRITAQDDEEVIRRSEARRPGVRAALKSINEPGEGHVERGLSALFRKRG